MPISVKIIILNFVSILLIKFSSSPTMFQQTTDIHGENIEKVISISVCRNELLFIIVLTYDWIESLKSSSTLLSFKYARNLSWSIMLDSSFVLLQWSAVITRSDIVRYYMINYKKCVRMSTRPWIHKRHPIPRPSGRAMGCPLRIFWENGPRYNGTALYIHIHCLSLHGMAVFQNNSGFPVHLQIKI